MPGLSEEEVTKRYPSGTVSVTIGDVETAFEAQLEIADVAEPAAVGGPPPGVRRAVSEISFELDAESSRALAKAIRIELRRADLARCRELSRLLYRPMTRLLHRPSFVN